MKKFAVLALTLSAMLVFTACGSKEATTTTETTTTEVATTEANDNVKVGEVKDDEGNTFTAAVTFENEAPVSVKFDCIQENGESKYEAAAAGTYKMTDTGLTWNEQADALAAFLAENNFDAAALEVTEDGHTDAVTGVSIKVPSMIEAFEAALNN
ncbi:hypothetical protein [Cellulosilyticum ruminicola]|uniref:hypothetical protein n=1 Tax=Cellulosilyticum ruminicola TaxID=425254 RepID=UPI0006CFFB21|nr:hypothetical protein [Cellulosilyticum ruminicola]